MIKTTFAALSVAALLSAMPALAAGTTSSAASTTAGAATTASTSMGRAEAGKLIGQSVETPTGERIGEVEAVNIGADGKVTNVIVGVGGFLGVGERDVALGWKDLQITDNGKKVVANTTKARLEGMAPYKYSDAKHRGTVFEGSR